MLQEKKRNNLQNFKLREIKFKEIKLVIQQEFSMKTQLNNSIQIGHYQLDLNTVLGKGATGYVYRGFDTTQGNQVAIKAIQMSNINNEVTQYLLEAQKKALKAINNQFVVKCLDIIQKDDYCYIVTEECSNGTLRDYIKSKGTLSNDQALNCFRKIVYGYCAIIDAHIIHRDLKTANIMLKENGDPAIIDFGYAEMIMGKRPLIKYNVGSPSYMSPQAYLQSRYSEKSDIWALGVVLYEMLTGKTMDQGKNIKKYFQEIQHQQMGFNMKDNSFSDLAKQLLGASLKTSTEQRATSHRLKYFLDLGLGPLEMPGHGSIIVGKENSTITYPSKKIFNYFSSQIPNGVKTPMRKQFTHARTFSNSKLIFANKTNYPYQSKRTSVNEPKYINSFMPQPSLQLTAYKCAQRQYYQTQPNIQSQFIKVPIANKPTELKLLYNSRVQQQNRNSKKMPLTLFTGPRSSKQIHQGKIISIVKTVTSSKII